MIKKIAKNVFIDFQEELDTVDHNILTKKHGSYDIRLHMAFNAFLWMWHIFRLDY